ncbi:hypothetical protein E7Z59_07180 [Robertkochia marina]|uniref:Metal-dependent HD superfamily phosphohydrolase n=1 Tax=Robertkochia marina TaxID=1227945 RepID=A0A4S3M074_9FLAO|nr:hypothetical protein [Robertkochia marina]THD67437.1 hypothetical protein E7Z59_07180 [Robertkochia marina]TRZ44692.1 hypothetical protein D3A96_08770 [Robertkochia marina]
MKAAELKNIWHQLTSKYSDDKELIENLWSELEQCYMASGRYYHNLEHIGYMITLALEHQEHIEDPNVLLFSIFYHDIIYQPGSTQNEEKSAELARLRLTALQVPKEKVNRCCEQILATRSHKGAEDSDTQYLLDIDLAIIGETPVKFEAYTKQIGKEFSKLPSPLFKAGRMFFLKEFLGRRRIYQTDRFYKEREAQARTNLTNLLRSAQKKS